MDGIGLKNPPELEIGMISTIKFSIPSKSPVTPIFVQFRRLLGKFGMFCSLTWHRMFTLLLLLVDPTWWHFFYVDALFCSALLLTEP